MSFKVAIGYTRHNPPRERNRWFETIEQAIAFCSEIFRKTNIVLSIKRVE